MNTRSFSAHIVGGEMFYECLGNDNYEITLKIYRDCYASGPNVADFDNPAEIGIYDASGILLETVFAFYNTRTNIPPTTNNPCLQPPSNVCVEEAIYNFTRYLAPSSGGYHIVYQRCCRNATIINIINPSEVGATYSTHIPGSAVAACNSSPYFEDFPPIVICANEALVFDHSAIDPDGDVLVYELCSPFSGASDLDPQPSPPLFIPFIGTVNWRASYSANNPLAASPPLSIDAQTGILTGTPNLQGQFVVGVCVKEYRNGNLIGETKRDFQFNVTPCLSDVKAIIPVIDTTGATATSTAGIFTIECQGFSVRFVNNSINGSTYAWDFGDPTTSNDKSALFEPSYTYPDSGSYIATLIVNPGFNCADTTSVIVRIYPKFTADFSFIPACSNEPVNFTDQSTTDYGVVESWTWNLGDGSMQSLKNPQHLYAAGGTYTVTLHSTTDKGCSDIQTKSVVVYPVPDVYFSYTPPCINTPVIFSDETVLNSGSIGVRYWDLDNNVTANLPTVTNIYTSLGTYNISLIVTSDFGCKDSLKQTILVNPLPVVTTRADTIICFGDQVKMWADGGIMYNWSPVDGLDDPATAAPLASPAVTTHYTVTVTDGNLCQETGNVSIGVNPLPPTTAGKDTFICLGDTLQLSGSGGVSFTWSPGFGMSDSTLSNPSVSPSESTTYILTSVSNEGCSNTDDIFIEVQRPIEVSMEEDNSICRHDTILLSASGGKYYEWSPASALSGNQSNIFPVKPDQTTIYRVIISNDCFIDSGFTMVTVHDLPIAYAGEDDSIYRDEFSILEASGGIDYFWDPVEGLEDPFSPITRASPFNTTHYQLTVLNEYGCLDKDTVTIFVEAVNLILVPSAFTPNNDGKNDFFRIIRHLNIDRLITFKVFNRWGRVVFETTNINLGWDGNYKGQPLPVSTFTYLIQAINRDQEIIEKTGSVTLIR